MTKERTKKGSERQVEEQEEEEEEEEATTGELFRFFDTGNRDFPAYSSDTTRSQGNPPVFGGHALTRTV
jgi:hypothetical protein